MFYGISNGCRGCQRRDSNISCRQSARCSAANKDKVGAGSGSVDLSGKNPLLLFNGNADFLKSGYLQGGVAGRGRAWPCAAGRGREATREQGEEKVVGSKKKKKKKSF